MFKFELGQELKDSVTGYVGTVISRNEHLTGCNTYGLQRRYKAGEKIESAEWFDENRLEATGKKTAIPGLKNPDRGGPQQSPTLK